ncbi:hypothetical protein B0T16DRAFT_420730 [Cercophora newfieldiana]|uniref:Heterokaryon incompatibility domain-containing protein n=1 Tax=Cercophora newfieldiana TaxID=92897 RepID=A0AA39XX70_9PEZI|nr:hypothetical protein B0T16DRAFT_420730 [Cercophora newfieldiana]
MNHLPQKDAEHIIFPLIARQRTYAPDDFFRLPVLHGCSGVQLSQKGPSLLPLHEQPAFLQEWLFFALIAVVLNREIDATLFRQYRDGAEVVDTGSIRSLFDECSSASLSSVGGRDWNHRTRAILALEEARKFVLTWCSDRYVYLSTPPEHSESESPTPSRGEGGSGVQFRLQHRELCLSFGIIGETLDRLCARQMEWSPLTDSPEPYGSWEDHITDGRSWGFSNLLRERMIDMGWCRHEVRRISAMTGDLSSLYYISSFAFDPATKQDHSRCVDDRCVQDPWAGFSVHSDNCDGAGGCDRLLPSEEELIRIIDAGDIPLLLFDGDANLILTEYRLGESADGGSISTVGIEERFVAISHAWSDGLGPSDGQGLPICRLAQIRNALRKDPDEPELGDMRFWIDSLCIPRQQNIRNKAIQMMGDIYSRAHTVLVLDSNLRLTPADPSVTSQLEAIIRINTGSWCTRMWTLPEGIEARNVHFEFSDRLLSIKQLRSHYKDVKHNPRHPDHHVYKAGWVFSPSIFILRRWMDGMTSQATTATADSKTIGHLWLSMQWRQTARREDETLCLARILDLDPLPILNCEGAGDELKDERMARFLESMDERIGIPPGMVFLPGPKLPMRGIAWAPRSWMTRRSRDAGAPLLVTDQRPSFLTSRGLLVQYPGVQLHPRRGAPEARCFWIPTASKLRSWLRIRYARDVHGQGEVEWAAAWKTACSGDGLPCIIRSRFDDHDEPEIGLLVQRMGRESSMPGRSRSDVFWVKALCRVWIQVETDSAVVAAHSENFRLHVGSKTWGEALDGDQRWVVDGEHG